MKKLIHTFMLVSSIVLTSCTSIMNNIPGVYSIDVQQGNIINQDMIDQLRPKMSKRQVLYILGSPMLVDVFHEQRWDYIYSKQPGGESREQKRLALFFNGDVLSGIQGDFRPSSLPVTRPSNETTIEVPERDLEKTLWEKITGLFSDDAPLKPEPSVVEEEATAILDDEANEKIIETEN